MKRKRSLTEDAVLLKKGLNQELTDCQEQENFKVLLSNKKIKSVYDELSEGPYLEAQFLRLNGYNSAKAYARFLKEVNKNSSKNKHIRRYIYYTSAACILLMFALTCFLPESSKQNLSSIHLITQIKPGETKANLFLSDGHVIEANTENLQYKSNSGFHVEYNDGLFSYKLEKPGMSLFYNDLVVPRGGEMKILLSDGSKIWLNSGSRLKHPVAFTGDERTVYLEGEAFFEIAENKECPFIVKTKFGTIRVLGTKFGINAYDNGEPSATLVEGKISFETPTQSSPVILYPGEQIRLTESGQLIKRKVETEEYVGWKDGVYVFKNKKLREIMETLECWYDVSVTFTDKTIEDLSFTGKMDRYENINVFMEALERTRDVSYQINGNKIILSK